MVKLSDMVLNHQVRFVLLLSESVLGKIDPDSGCFCDDLQIAHLVLVEQVYRAWTILRGEPYHH